MSGVHRSCRRRPGPRHEAQRYSAGTSSRMTVLVSRKGSKPFGRPPVLCPDCLNHRRRCRSRCGTRCVRRCPIAAARRPGGPGDVVGEHRGVEPVDGVVGGGDGPFLVVGRDDTQHGSEDLLLRDRRASCPRCRRRWVRRSNHARGPSVGRHRSPGWPPVHPRGDVPLDPVALAAATSGPICVPCRTGRPPEPGRTRRPGPPPVRRGGVHVTTIRVSDEQTCPVSMHSARARVGRGSCQGPRRRGPRRPTCHPVRGCTGRSARRRWTRCGGPAAVDPVNVILSTRGSRTSSSETARSAVTTFSTPGGSPTASAISART